MINLFSLLLGLLAWGLGFCGAMRKHHRLCFYSFTACGIALVLQFFEIRRRVAAEAWYALLDTVPALSGAAAILLAVTVLLNAAALYRSGKT